MHTMMFFHASQVFLRAGASAALDRQRALARTAATCRIQASWRGVQDRRAWLAMRKAAVVVQVCVCVLVCVRACDKC